MRLVSKVAYSKMSALVLVLLALTCAHGETKESSAVREFYIAAVEIGWDYIHLETGGGTTDSRKMSNNVQKYIKAVYREYTDSTYSVAKPRPAWAGIQGPVIHAKAGERVVVHFKNLASKPYSISPVGITYSKQSEGAGYDDSTGGQEKLDDAVLPGGYYEYLWDINPKDGPTASDPECLTYSYSSQVDTVRDTNSGLIGALLICKSSAFKEDGQRRRVEFVLLFAVFDETKSWYAEVGERRSRDRFKKGNMKQYHTINGYVNSTLPGLTICQSRDHVFWHLIGLGTAPEIHSIQFEEHTLKVMLHRKFHVEMTPMTFITAEMKPTTVGQFLISCQIHAHKHAGMVALFTVDDCPAPDVRNAHDEEEMDYSDNGEDLFNMLTFPKRPGLRSFRRQNFKTWVYFIAAEEVTWDYSANRDLTDREFSASSHQLGYQYKKVVYVEYTDKTFTQKKNPEGSLFGPILKGEVNDQFNIIFRNKASRPFNIYPNGISKVSPLQKSTNEAEKNLRVMGVPPNGTYGYMWKLTWDDGPLEEDPQCLTQLYQSTVHPERDLASGLVGMLLICKHEAIDQSTGRLVVPDKERSLIFAVMDENKSWYIGENIQRNSQDPSKINPADPAFYKSNLIHSVNGVMFNRRQFLVCQNDVTFWHVANIGPQSEFLSIYFTGNPFNHNNRYRFVLTLFPMTGETVSMETELLGEWEISAFDSALKNQGMSFHYMVNPCDNVDLPLVDREEDEIDVGLTDYLNANFPQWQRSSKPQNRTQVGPCKKPTPDPNATQSVNTTKNNITDDNIASGEGSLCEVEDVPGGGIPLEVLEELDRQEEQVASSGQDGATTHEKPRNVRRRREVEGDGRDAEVRVVGDEGTGMGSGGEVGANWTDARAMVVAWDDATYEKNETNEDTEGSNEIFLGSGALVEKQNSTLEPTGAQGLDLRVEPSNHIQLGPDQQMLEGLDQDRRNTSENNMTTPEAAVRVDYDDYGQQMNGTLYFGSTDYVDLRSMGQYSYRNYYIAAEEITWDYGIKRPHQLIKPREMRRGMRKFLTEYKKVVFRAYRDENFLQPVARGELQQHLGIMGPVVRAEINDFLTVTFKNKASRPYSFHLHGVYDRSQGAGIVQTQASAASVGVPGEAVPPGEVRVYKLKISRKQGPTDTEFACKAGAYYSTVNKERDLHSGLIGPLVICKPGTLHRHHNLQPGIQEYSLLFHTFDETKSWYLEENLQKYCTPPCQADPQELWFQIGNRFAAINGYVAETLPGLLVAQYQPVRWHLLNVGGDGEYHAVQFHGLPFSIHTEQEHRMGVYNLYPGVFGTIEMEPPTVGMWLVECMVGEQQLAGMRAKLLVYDPRCILPLGMKSGRIEDSQITASDHLDNWEPSLARLDLSGSVNAWKGQTFMSWLQVDLLRPTLVHRVQTQGARAFLTEHFVTQYTLLYSLDGETWIMYRGNNTRQTYGRNSFVTFNGNMDSSKVKENRLYPPIIARYIRIRPINARNKPALRLELLGCDLNSCSLPLIRERRLPDASFNSSSSRVTWIHNWGPHRARLNQDGSDNAWRPQNNNPHEWLQVNLTKEMRITGVVTQGAWSMLKQMMVTEFSVTYSDDGQLWNIVMQEGTQMEKIFTGNSDADEEALTLFDPPIFGRLIRIHPVGWINDIALRVEILGCDTQQRLLEFP